MGSFEGGDVAVVVEMGEVTCVTWGGEDTLQLGLALELTHICLEVSWSPGSGCGQGGGRG